MSNQADGVPPQSLDAALVAVTSPDWETRLDAVGLLAARVDDSRVFSEMVRRLDDADIAVIEEAAEALVRGGGSVGLREVLRWLGANDDNAGYHIMNRLGVMWLDGFQLLDGLHEILDQQPTGATREGVLEMLDLLEGDRSH
jgi:hypothetical protein